MRTYMKGVLTGVRDEPEDPTIWLNNEIKYMTQRVRDEEKLSPSSHTTIYLYGRLTVLKEMKRKLEGFRISKDPL